MHVGLVVGIFTFSAMLVRPWAGFFLDTRGRRGILLGGLAIFIVSALAYNLSTSLILLLLNRTLHGLGWGACTTAAGTVAADTIPPRRMGEGMGYFGLATALSMAIAPAAGLFLVNNYTFTHLFFTSALLACIAFVLAASIRYHKVSNKSGPVRPALYEKKAARPSLVVFFVTSTFGALVSFLVLYAGQRGINDIGPFFIVFAVTMFVSRPLAGPIADKKGFDVVVIPGLALITFTMLLLSTARTLETFLIAATCYGLGFGATQPSLQALAVRGLPPQRRGAANGTFFSAFDLGIGASSIGWGFLAQATSYSFMYAAATIPAVLAAIIYLSPRGSKILRSLKENER